MARLALRPHALLLAVACQGASAAAAPTAGGAAVAPAGRGGRPPPAPVPAWSVRRPDVLRDVRAGRPLVIHVVVPLCNGALIDCGAAWAGRPGDLARNVYWGAIFGARRFLERRGSGWERVLLQHPTPAASGPVPAPGVAPTPALPAHVLERATYRRWEDGSGWGLEADRRVEVVVVLEAFHGAHHDAAIERFFGLAGDPGTVAIPGDGSATEPREERLHVVGWAGHNRLMDGTAVPPVGTPPTAPGSAFVLACNSRGWFSEGLAARDARFVVGTRQLMAPEGYVLDAVLRGLGQNDSERGLARRATDATARWQRVPRRVVAPIFAER